MVVPAGFPSFPCPKCGGALPATMAAGMVIPCPLCQQQIVVPAGGGPTAAQAAAYQAWAMQHGNTAAAMHDQQAHRQQTGQPSLFASTSTRVIVEDGAGGLVAVGAQVGADGSWHVRGVDPQTHQVRWEAMHGSHFQTCPEPRSICGRNGRIYIAHQGVLTALDGPTGRALWQARLGARIDLDVDGAPVAGDETDLREVAGVVIVRTEDDAVSAFDRDTGQGLWRRAINGHPQCDGTHLFIEEEFRKLDLVAPRTGQTIARFGTTEAALTAGALVINAEERGDDEQDGVALIDAATGQERWFVAADSVTLDAGVAIVGGEVLVPLNGNHGTELLPISAAGAAPKKGFFARLFGGGGSGGGRKLPWPDHDVDALWVVGDALVVDLRDRSGHRRIAALDPRAMTARHDSGPIPSGVAPGVRLGPPGSGLVAYSFGESNGPKTLRLFDVASGALRWERTFADLDDVAFRAGQLVLRTDGGPCEILDPASGQTRVTF